VRFGDISDRSPDLRDPASDQYSRRHDNRESQIDRIDRDKEDRGCEDEEGNDALPTHLRRRGELRAETS